MKELLQHPLFQLQRSNVTALPQLPPPSSLVEKAHFLICHLPQFAPVVQQL